MERLAINLSDPDQVIRSGSFFPVDVAEIVAEKTSSRAEVTPVGSEGDVKVSFDKNEAHDVFNAALDTAYRAKRAITPITRSRDAVRQGVLADVRHSVGMGAVSPSTNPVRGSTR